jgi:CheY-specific phosphatase CheX
VDSSCSGLFDGVYHQNSLRVGFRIFLFDATKVSFVNVHGANFISKLSTAGAEHEVTFAICGLNKRNTTENLYHELEDAGVMIYADMKSFFEDEDILKEAKNLSGVSRTNTVITKKIVSILPTVVESSMSIIEVLSSYKAVKKSIVVQELSLNTKEKLLSANIGIYGDISCILIMVFDESIAKKTCNILLKEESNSDDLLDALGELTHIIASKISQILTKQQIKTNITMPRVFENIDDVVAFQKGNKGAQVNMEIDGKILTLFLAK